MINRVAILDKLKDNLINKPEKTAVLLVDMHRGHLDPEVATKPVDSGWAREVIRNRMALLDLARNLGMKIIHIVLDQRVVPGIGREGLVNPRTRVVRRFRLSGKKVFRWSPTETINLSSPACVMSWAICKVSLCPPSCLQCGQRQYIYQ